MQAMRRLGLEASMPAPKREAMALAATGIAQLSIGLVLIGRNGQSPKGVLAGVESCEGDAGRWTVICQGELAAVIAEAKQKGFDVSEAGSAILDDIFVARAGKRLSSMDE